MGWAEEVSEANDFDELARVIFGYRGTAIVGVALDGGIIDALSGGSSVSSVADELGVDAEWLDQLLRALHSLGIVESLDGGAVGLTSRGRHLANDGPARTAALYAWRVCYPNYLGLSRQSRAGGRVAGAECQFGAPFYDRVMATPDLRVPYAQMLQNPGLDELLGSLLQGSLTGRIYDIGGGDGSLLAELLKRNPAATGVVFERADTAESLTRDGIAEHPEIANRMELVVGDFLKDIPGDGRHYLYSRVFANWRDETVLEMLRVLARAMSPVASLLILEQLLNNESKRGEFRDVANVDLLANFGGHLRSIGSFTSLLSDAGLAVQAVVPLAGSDVDGWNLIIARLA